MNVNEVETRRGQDNGGGDAEDHLGFPKPQNQNPILHRA